MNAAVKPADATAPELLIRLGLHEYDAFCQRCGRRAGSRYAIDADAPADGFFRVTCLDCARGDREAA